jgi:hypothetical protein
MWNEEIDCHLRYNRGIFQERVRKWPKNIPGQHSLPPGRDLNPGLPQTEAGALSTAARLGDVV